MQQIPVAISIGVRVGSMKVPRASGATAPKNGIAYASRFRHQRSRGCGSVEAWSSQAHLQEIYFLWRPFLPDADDDMILELAVAAQCRIIVTYNVRDFAGVDQFGIDCMAPGDFLRLLRGSS